MKRDEAQTAAIIHNDELAVFIDHILDIQCLGICYFYPHKKITTPYIWRKDSLNHDVLSTSIEDLLSHFILEPSFTYNKIMEYIREHYPHILNQIYVHIITYQKVSIGFVVIGRSMDVPALCDEDYTVCSKLLDLSAGELIHSLEKSAYEKLFYTVINGISDYIYVTDPESDEILFMNDMMKKVYDIDDPIGKTCWKLLQQGKNERCEFCPIEQLKQNPDKTITWEERSSVNHHYYENKDSLIRWLDGRLVHLQQSTDITDFKKISQAATIDEASGSIKPSKSQSEITLLSVDGY